MRVTSAIAAIAALFFDGIRSCVGFEHDGVIPIVARRPLEEGRRFLRDELVESGSREMCP
jgi:hypothetical protein